MNPDRRFRQLLCELAMISNGGTYSWNSSGGGKAGSRPPTSGDSEPGLQRFCEDYLHASGDGARLSVIHRMEEELRHLRGQYERKVEGETEKQWKDRLIVEGEGFEPNLVALRFNTTPKIVTQVRVERLCLPTNGRPMVPVTSMAAKRERVTELLRGNVPVRTIASLVKVSHTTVVQIKKTSAQGR